MKKSTGRIPASNPKANYLAHRREIDEAVARVLQSGSYVLGDEVVGFEEEFAAYIGARFAIGVASGTEALHLALRACGVGQGDEVITVSHTAVATVVAIELCGATPVLVDIDPNTYTLDPGQLESAITERSKAVVPVHLYGHPADLPGIMAIAQEYNLWVVEDCAQSHGATLKGVMTGGHGHMGAFSFYPTKNLGAMGDGGVVTTSQADLAERARLLREYGWQQRYVSRFPGVNSRLDELQAAVLRVKLQYLDQENRRRQDLARTYEEKLSSTRLRLPSCQPEVNHVYHQYVIRCGQRDSLKTFLNENHIDTLVHYPVPIHHQPAYQGRLPCASSMAHSEGTAKQILSLPIYPELTNEEVQHVVETVIQWDQHHRR
jgi:dTDP-4-amino-4,6-dideoxygalactose transaminase